MRPYDCPQCESWDVWSTDNCQWMDDRKYYMEYQCNVCGCLYYVDLVVATDRIIIADGDK